MREAPVLRETLLTLSALKLPDGRRACVVWRTQVGKFRRLYDDQIVSVGFTGLADIVGWVQCGAHAVFLAVECKSDTGRLRPEQVNFRDVVVESGGIHIVARSAKDAAERVLEAVNVRC